MHKKCIVMRSFMWCDKGKPPGCVFCGDAAAVFFDGRADKGDHGDPDESFGENGALNILPICIGCGIVLNKNGKSVDKFWGGWYATVRQKIINTKYVFNLEVPI